LSPQRKIPADILFKFVGSDKTLSADKFVLGNVSDVFHEQFYGPLSENAKAEGLFFGGVEHVLEQKFSYETFNTFLQHIYGNKEIIKNCSNFEILFELLEMAKFHLIDKLTAVIQKKIEKLKVTMENLLLVLYLVDHYKNLCGFQEITAGLAKKISTRFGSLSCKEQNKFYKENRADNPDLVNALVDLMAEDDSSKDEGDQNLVEGLHCTLHYPGEYRFKAYSNTYDCKKN